MYQLLPYFNQWSHDANSCRPSVGSNPTLFAYSEEEYLKTFRFWKHACFERQAQQPACKFPPHEASSRALNSTDHARICWDPRQSISWLGSWEVSKSWIVLKWGQRPAKKRLLGRKNGGRQAASTITIYLAAYSFARRYYFPGTF